MVLPLGFKMLCLPASLGKLVHMKEEPRAGAAFLKSSVGHVGPPISEKSATIGSSSLIEYRSFRNFDPPGIWMLWRDGQMGRGAALPRSIDAFEAVNYGQPYFDPAGMVVALEGHWIVGIAHAGFAATEDRTTLDRTTGVICSVLVHPKCRRQGIGTELIRRAEAYLRGQSVTRLLAGPARGLDPFYFGLYGGCRPSGFLLTDPAGQPFFQKLGYSELEKHGVFERDLTIPRDPTNMRLVQIRRQTELEALDSSESPNWWWYTHLGRTDSVRYCLKMKRTGEPIATVNVVPLDHYEDAWRDRSVGIVDVRVAPAYRGQGYGQTLLIEVVRLLRQDRFHRAEIHAPDNSPVALRAVLAAGFSRVDTGIVYQKT